MGKESLRNKRSCCSHVASGAETLARFESAQGDNRMQSYQGNTNAEPRGKTFYGLSGCPECLHRLCGGSANWDFVETGFVKEPSTIDCSAILSDQSIAASRRTCFRFYAKAGSCSGSLDGFYTFGG
jgi:hypothetical protein